MTAVVGRRDELERIERFLSDAEQRCASLIFEGEAGIGKTTVWREALRLAESEGCERSPQDLPRRKRSSASPRSRDLLAPVDEELLCELPEPQRRALDVALLRTSPSGRGADPRAVATGLLAVLTGLAKESGRFPPALAITCGSAR